MTTESLPNLIGVLPSQSAPLPEPIDAGFVYSTDATASAFPENLWVSCRAGDGSVAGHELAASGLNKLFRSHQESVHAGGPFALDLVVHCETANPEVQLKFSLGETRRADGAETQAFQAETPEVREVLVTVVDGTA